MSGQRRVGSSSGSGSKTISDVEPVSSSTIFGQLEHGALVGVPDVHRAVEVGVEQGEEPAHHVVDVAEASGSACRRRRRSAADRRAPATRKFETTRPSPGGEARAVRVEEPDDLDVDAELAVVGHREGLGVALRLVVDRAHPERVHVAPVASRAAGARSGRRRPRSSTRAGSVHRRAARGRASCFVPTEPVSSVRIGCARYSGGLAGLAKCSTASNRPASVTARPGAARTTSCSTSANRVGPRRGRPRSRAGR